MPIKVLLAEDHQITREIIRWLLELYPDLLVVGEAVDGHDAVGQAVQFCPDVAVLDLIMPKQDGIQTARCIRECSPITQVVILSMYGDKEYVVEALQAGIQGYVLKENAGSELVEAIRAAHAGRHYLSAKLLYHLDLHELGSSATCR